MKSQYKVWRNDSWTVEKFPRHGTALLYNATTGKYEFREILEKEDKPKKEYREVNLSHF